MPFEPTSIFGCGDTVLYRELIAGRQISHLKPATVVEDTPERIVLWPPVGTPVLYPEALHRSEDGVRQWDRGWRLVEVPWTAEVLFVMWPGKMHKIEMRWGQDRVFQGWKISLQSQLRRTRFSFDKYNYQLRVVVAPDSRWRWKNEGDLDLAVEAGRLTPEQREAIWAEGQRIVGEIERKAGPYAEGWEQWRPAADLKRPTLPSDWDDLSMYDEDFTPIQWADDLLRQE
ncbi:MAG: hypothetical protein GKR89_27480 [Candidatus Latescibacteria bacterium]|nr:hypothetical protein [Candidatus Latescibacterota bacterium]